MTPHAAVFCQLVVQGLALYAAWRLSQHSLARGVLLGAAVGFLAISLACADGAWLLAIVPLRDLALFGNQTPFAVGLLAGVVLGTPALARWRRMVVAGLVLFIADGATWLPLVKNPPPTADQWAEEACLQSTDSTCAPAAAATLLRWHGLPASETILAAWCLTTDAGTSRWGLWRGLCIATAGSPWIPRAGTPDMETVLNGPPAIVSVVLSSELDQREPRYRTEWGWILGQPHAVVVLGRSMQLGKVRIADPKIGLEEWQESGLRDLWNSQVVWLERR